MCDLEREIGLRLSGRILGVHPFATLIMPLRLFESKHRTQPIALLAAPRWSAAGMNPCGGRRAACETQSAADKAAVTSTAPARRDRELSL